MFTWDLDAWHLHDIISSGVEVIPLVLYVIDIA